MNLIDTTKITPYIGAGDVLIAIAHYLPRNRRCFKIAKEDSEYENPPRQPIHTFFFEQKKDFPDLLKNLSFHEKYTLPHSRELETDISTLFACGFIVVASNSPWHYHLAGICDNAFEEMLVPEIGPPAAQRRKITLEQDLQFQDLTKRFDEKVAVNTKFRC